MAIETGHIRRSKSRAGFGRETSRGLVTVFAVQMRKDDKPAAYIWRWRWSTSLLTVWPATVGRSLDGPADFLDDHSDHNGLWQTTLVRSCLDFVATSGGRC